MARRRLAITRTTPERFALFSRAVLETAKLLFPADVVHCHDWQTGLVPVLLKTAYAHDPALRDTATLFTLHNLGYQGLFPSDVLDRIGLGWELFTIHGLEYYGKVNFLKGALLYADFLNTVSKAYAAEIQTAEYGFGLHGRSSAPVGGAGGYPERSGLHALESCHGPVHWPPATPPKTSAASARARKTC